MLTRSFHIITIIVMMAILTSVTSVFANTSNWNFESTIDGRYLSGSANGVVHDMDAGKLTISGSILVEEIYPTTNPTATTWVIQVKKQRFGFDPTTCSIKVTPSTEYSDPVSFTKKCGQISKGKYYLVIYRVISDGRSYSGSGTLETD